MQDDGVSVVEVTHRIDAELRAFDGHFPGAPVLPGAYLLAIVLQRLEQQPALAARLGPAPQVQQVKFLAPVGPGETLHIRFEPLPQGVGFAVLRGSVMIARGQLGTATGADPA
jgi:3-hydroxyacyl-[acyl-carrier-protein] dehydratase